MKVSISTTDPRPIYLQIMDEIRRALVLGNLKPEDPLPSIRQRASELRVNPNTVTQAYTELEREGIVYVRRGRGTFVSPDVRPDREARTALAKQVHAAPTGTGAYRVMLEVEAYKIKADSVGNETRVPMDDLVDVGVFAAAEDGEEHGKLLYLQKHRLQAGAQTITVTVPRVPAQAGIDPYHKLIDRKIDDNVEEVAVEEKRGSPGQ